MNARESIERRMKRDQRWVRLFAEARNLGLSLADATEWATREYRVRYVS